ncbi:MAG: patatin-like phospholipase family protein [Vibrio sp.]
MTMQKSIVVEGGAMRGIFSAGVLDHWIQEAESVPQFDFCIGVSAGSTSLASWLSSQHMRTYKVITDYSCRPEFINMPRFMRGGHGLDLDWLWEICIQEIPIDVERMLSRHTPLYAVTTQVDTAQAHYIEVTQDNAQELLKASCSVPLAYRNYPKINGYEMTDGGVADSIPVEKAYQMGARDITVILSNPLGYQKKPSRTPWLTKALFREKPKLAAAMLERWHKYNQSIAFIQSPPKDCTIRVIAPPADFPVKRLTKDIQKLNQGYAMGIEAAKDYLNKMNQAPNRVA